MLAGEPQLRFVDAHDLADHEIVRAVVAQFGRAARKYTRLD